MRDLSIVIVSYNTCGLLRTCLSSIYRETAHIDFEIVVVDNASTDGSIEMITSDYPAVKILRNDHNSGFAAANNIAIRKSSARFVLLLNPDTEILDGAIQKTIRFIEAHPKAGIVGCKLKYPDGRFQPSAYSFPTVWNMFAEATFLYRVFPKTKLFGGYHLTYLDYSHDVQVDWLIGAFLLIRREVIDTVGMLDEQFFMYAEDTDYCYMAKQAGFEVWFTPRGEIFH
jgi:GT2 family glycosyltransferase